MSRECNTLNNSFSCIYDMSLADAIQWVSSRNCLNSEANRIRPTILVIAVPLIGLTGM